VLLWRYDCIEEVDKKMRELFVVNADDTSFLWNEYTHLDKTKRLADFKFDKNEVSEKRHFALV